MSFVEKMQRKAMAKNIRKYRELRYPGLGGKTKCALTLKVSLQQWSHWENGRRIPSAKNLKLISVALGVSEDVLLVDKHPVDDNAAIVAVTEGVRELLGVLEYLLVWQNTRDMRTEAVKTIREYAMDVMAEAESR